jgi:MipA family protein
MRGRNSILALLLLLLLAAPASPAERRLRPLWEAGAGVGLLSLSDYRGADQTSQYVLPIPYFVYRGEILQVDRENIRSVLLKGDGWDVDVSAGGSVPGRSGHNRARSGMPDLDATLEIGPQLNVRWLDTERYRLRLQLPLREVRAVGGGLPHVGLLFAPALQLQVWDTGPGGAWKLAVVGGPLWADRQYHDYFYRVDAADATAERPAYASRGGYSGTRLTATLSRRFEKIWVGAYLRVDDLHGAAFADSPLLRRKTSYVAGFGVSWVFGQSARLVMSDD